MDVCKHEVVAHLVVKSGTATLILRAFGSIVQEIAGKEAEDIQYYMALLLKSSAFNMTHSEGIIRSVSRNISS